MSDPYNVHGGYNGGMEEKPDPSNNIFTTYLNGNAPPTNVNESAQVNPNA